mgnify:CR=1 FL=1
MATVKAQKRWRGKVHYVKRQLNVMSPVSVHTDLEELALNHNLRGKGEAVAFAAYVAKGLVQYSEHSTSARKLLDTFVRSYQRDRTMLR